jgi:anthranilate phosphoribosyltransferase
MVTADAATAFELSGGWPSVLSRLFRREDLTTELATSALTEILDGRAKPSQIGAFLAAMRTKGESVEEMIGLSRAMQAHAEHLYVAPGAIDTCGTGGDRSGTVNVSTMAALVAAGAGAVVCKHGGGASSSLSGSADVLRSLGVAVDLGPEQVAACIEAAGIGFCFAPRFHPAMRHAGPIRAELGVGTIFNFLGPLCNPAMVTRQVVGVGDPQMAEKMLLVLEANGADEVMVVFGHDGLDELSVCAPSTILTSRRAADGSFERETLEVDPRSFGLGLAKSEDLHGADAAHNASRVHALLAGERGPQRDFLLLNAAAALKVAGLVASFEAGIDLAGEVIDSGAASAALDRLVSTSRELAGD